MQSYDVRLVKSIAHRLQTVISVTAGSEEEAKRIALERARDSSIDWSEPLAESIVEGPAAVVDVEVIVDLDNP